MAYSNGVTPMRLRSRISCAGPLVSVTKVVNVNGYILGPFHTSRIPSMERVYFVLFQIKQCSTHFWFLRQLMSYNNIISRLTPNPTLVFLPYNPVNTSLLSYRPFSSSCSRLTLHRHYSDAIMSTMASQMTSVSVVYSTVCSGAD